MGAGATVSSPPRAISPPSPLGEGRSDFVPLGCSYRAWLEGLEGLEGAGRGDAYYESPEGARLEPWPKIYTGSQQGGSRGKQRRFKGGRRGRGGGPGDPRARGGGSQDDRP